MIHQCHGAICHHHYPGHHQLVFTEHPHGDATVLGAWENARKTKSTTYKVNCWNCVFEYETQHKHTYKPKTTWVTHDRINSLKFSIGLHSGYLCCNRGWSRWSFHRKDAGKCFLSLGILESDKYLGGPLLTIKAKFPESFYNVPDQWLTITSLKIWGIWRFQDRFSWLTGKNFKEFHKEILEQKLIWNYHRTVTQIFLVNSL